MLTLPHRMTIVVPAVKRSLGKVPEELEKDILTRVQGDMSRLFGGCTTYPASGAWRDDKGLTHVEPVHVVESYAGGDEYDNGHSAFLTLVKDVGYWLDQDAVAYTIDDTMYIVDCRN